MTNKESVLNGILAQNTPIRASGVTLEERESIFKEVSATFKKNILELNCMLALYEGVICDSFVVMDKDHGTTYGFKPEQDHTLIFYVPISKVSTYRLEDASKLLSIASGARKDQDLVVAHITEAIKKNLEQAEKALASCEWAMQKAYEKAGIKA